MYIELVNEKKPNHKIEIYAPIPKNKFVCDAAARRGRRGETERESEWARKME